MIIYSLVFVSLFLLYVLKLKFKNSDVVITMLLGLFLCFGYMTGSDWRTYEILYQEASLNYLKDYTREPFFYLTMLLFKWLNFSFFQFLILLKCVYLFVFYKLTKKVSSNICLFMLMSLASSLLFILVDNPLRFMIGLIGTNLACLCLLNRKLLLSFIFIFIGALFHNTLILCVIMPFIYLFKDKINNLSSVWYFVIYLFILASNFVFSNLKDLILFIGVRNEELMFRSGSYNQFDELSLFSFGSLMNIFLFLSYIFFFKKRIYVDSFVSSMCLFYFFISRLMWPIPTGFRLAIPFSIFLTSVLVHVLLKYRRNLFSYAYILSIYISYHNHVTNSFVYIPYTNILPYVIMDNYPDYNFRSNYNLLMYDENKK